jgi:hypothetical protein
MARINYSYKTIGFGDTNDVDVQTCPSVLASSTYNARGTSTSRVRGLLPKKGLAGPDRDLGLMSYLYVFLGLK